MSRIGKKTIKVPSGVEFKIEGSKVKVKGPKGTLEREMHGAVKVAVQGDQVTVGLKEGETEDNGRFHGLTRTLLENMVFGVTQGYSKSLLLVGVGYRAAAKGKGVTLSLGFSHPIDFDPPAGVTITVDKQTNIVVAGPNKEDVGMVAAKLRSFRPPEPYHGKGVRYVDEVIATKVGKAAGKK